MGKNKRYLPKHKPKAIFNKPRQVEAEVEIEPGFYIKPGGKIHCISANEFMKRYDDLFVQERGIIMPAKKNVTNQNVATQGQAPQQPQQGVGINPALYVQQQGVPFNGQQQPQQPINPVLMVNPQSIQTPNPQAATIVDRIPKFASETNGAFANVQNMTPEQIQQTANQVKDQIKEESGIEESYGIADFAGDHIVTSAVVAGLAGYGIYSLAKTFIGDSGESDSADGAIEELLKAFE